MVKVPIMDVTFKKQIKISLRNEVDRFGFSYVLAKKIGFNLPPKSFACFAHGWVWRKDLKIEDFGYFHTPKNIPIVVATKTHKDFLTSSGFNRIYEGGLPFAYVERSNIKRKSRTLLIMPPHSMRFDGISIDTKLLDYIESIKSCFSEICFCLHYDDYSDEEVTNILKKRNLNFILGADASDANSLLRMREIFDYFEYVTTTVIGSHVLYASFCNCKVSLLRNFHYIYPKTIFKNYSMIQSIAGLQERYLNNFNNLTQLETDFPWLIVNHPDEAIEMTEWARQEIGFSNLLDNNLLIKILGWNYSSKAIILLRFLYNKLPFYYKL